MKLSGTLKPVLPHWQRGKRSPPLGGPWCVVVLVLGSFPSDSDPACVSLREPFPWLSAPLVPGCLLKVMASLLQFTFQDL